MGQIIELFARQCVYACALLRLQFLFDLDKKKFAQWFQARKVRSNLFGGENPMNYFPT